MDHLVRRTALSRAVLIAATLATRTARAAAYPDRPIRLIVNYPPGGPTDAVARLLIPSAGHTLGQSLVVENRGGAGGNIGAALVARATPDGYTILITASSHAINP